MNKLLIALLLSCVCVSSYAGTQQEKMKTCNADAKAKALAGDERKAFMKECLSADGAKSGLTAACCAATGFFIIFFNFGLKFFFILPLFRLAIGVSALFAERSRRHNTVTQLPNLKTEWYEYSHQDTCRQTDSGPHRTGTPERLCHS